MEKLKINKFEIENVKRVKAVVVKPTANGLTVIGGKNQQGKTTVLDSIAWALGGNKFRPSNPIRDGSVIPPSLKVTLSNGLIVERKGKKSDLKVIDPNGQKAGQNLLDSFVEELAIDLPKFINASNKEKANILLNIIGVGQQLIELEREETEIYNERRAIGQIADQKEKFAKEQTYYPDAPKELISIEELIIDQQNVLAKNGENQKLRSQAEELKKEYKSALRDEESIRVQLEAMQKRRIELFEKLEIANQSAENLEDQSTAELEENIANIEKINLKVRTNYDKEKAEDDAKSYREQYNSFTSKLNNIRSKKTALLENANLPLEELSVEEGELIYKGYKWDGMSGADQLKVATAIVRKLKPQCGFVLMDKLEQMDLDTLQEFGEWLEQEGLQVIATRVSTGEECSLIIEDGYVLKEKATTVFTKGIF